MSDFKIGDRVLVSSAVEPGPEKVFGRIDRIYPCLDDNDMLIVRLDNNNLKKYYKKDLIPVQDPKTISEEEFKTAVAKVTNPLEYAGTMGENSLTLLLSAGRLICERLHKELFGEKVND